MRDYKKLEVWRKAHLLTLMIYKDILPFFPDHEKFALANQLKRSAYSIPLNIAEGCGKNSNKDFTRYLDNALGSSNETEYNCLLAHDLEYLSDEKYNVVNALINEVKAMLISFIKYLRDETNRNL